MDNIQCVKKGGSIVKRTVHFRLEVLLITVLICICVMGCANKEKDNGDNENTASKDWYDDSDYIKIDCTSSAFGYSLTFLTKEQVKDVKYVSCTGENVDENTFSNVKIVDNTLENVKDFKYKGLYCSRWMIEADVNTDGEYKIDSVTLIVDGDKKTLSFKNPIKYTKQSDMNYVVNDEFSAVSFPNEFTVQFFQSGEKCKYEIVAKKDFKLMGVEAGGGAKVIDVEYTVNGVIKDMSEDGIDVKANDEISIDLGYELDDTNDLYYVLTNLFIKYNVDGEDKTSVGPISFKPLSPMDAELNKLKNYMDLMIEQ